MLVCFALEDEARAFRKLVAGRGEVSILITGIGRRKAEQAVRGFLAGNTPSQVLSCGFAGGLNPALQTGAVIFATNDATLEIALTGAGARAAQFSCAPRIATTVAEKAALRQATGADAVEMESAAIHEACRQRGIPCATVRVISDAAGENLPLDFNRLANADQSLNYRKLAWAIATTPGKIPALIQLQKNCRLAAEQLATVLLKACASS